MAPEIFKKIRYTYKVDIWSLGIVLYELITLDVPFKGYNMIYLKNNILSGAYNKVSLNFNLELKSILISLLSNNSYIRPTINELLDNNILKKQIADLKLIEPNYREIGSNIKLFCLIPKRVNDWKLIASQFNSENIKKQPTILRKGISNNTNFSKRKTKIDINLEENNKQSKIINHQCIKNLELDIIKLQKEISFKKIKLEFYKFKLFQSSNIKNNLYNEDNNNIKPNYKYLNLSKKNKFVFNRNNGNMVIKEVVKIPKKDIFKLPDIKPYNRVRYDYNR